MQPEAARAVADFLVSNFEQETAVTVNVLRAVPSDRLDYRPTDTSMSALELIRHITLADEWLVNCIAAGKFADPPDDSDQCGISSSSGAAERYAERMPAAFNRIRGMSGRDLVKDVDLLGTMQGPAIEFLSMALKHSIHHRGQLSSYLRSMGGKVPSIYGPSGDTQ